MKALADYMHEQGLKLGIYSDAGSQTCCSCRPGSLGHEYQDALTYAKWGVDLLKYDWYHTEDIDSKGAYKLMQDALYAAGRPVLCSLCEWGKSLPRRWVKEMGHMWRTMTISIPVSTVSKITGCSKPTACCKFSMDKTVCGHMRVRDTGTRTCFEVGNGMTVNRDRAHFTM